MKDKKLLRGRNNNKKGGEQKEKMIIKVEKDNKNTIIKKGNWKDKKEIQEEKMLDSPVVVVLQVAHQVVHQATQILVISHKLLIKKDTQRTLNLNKR